MANIKKEIYMEETKEFNKPIPETTGESQYRTVTTVTEFPESDFETLSIL